MSKRLLAILFALLILPLAGSSLLHVSAATFNPNLITDDSVFNNSNSMSASQIDAFLNTFSNSCISTNNGFQAIDPIGYNPTDGFLYGSNVSAGTVIAHAAQVYGLNPQVILTTLQKEQSLVQGDAGCSTNRYVKALGYGCPDGGSSYNYTGLNLYTKNGVTYTDATGVCVNSAAKAGFSQQVIHAAWMLRYSEQRSEGNIGWAVISGNWDNSDDLDATYSGYMTQGCFKRSKYDSSCTNYDGYITIDNTAVHLDSGATAALYRYTPHFSGNQNYSSIFSNWFGNPVGPAYNWSVSSQTVYADAAHTQKIDNGNAISIAPGQTVYLELKALNTGRATWTQNTRVATSHPNDRTSAFQSSDWMWSNRVTHMVESSVAPNNIGTFEFSLTAPQQAGVYAEYFNLVDDSVSWYNDIGMYVPISVVVRSYPPATTSSSFLDQTNNTLSSGQYLISPNGLSTLQMLPNGDLALYNDFQLVWHSNTSGSGATKLIAQTDGNFVLYRPDGQAVWGSATNGQGASKLVLQNDGNLVGFRLSDNASTWSTNTMRYGDPGTRVNGILGNGQVIYPGQMLQTPDRKYSMIMQYDGNLVLYSPSRALWASGTNGKAGAVAIMQTDGNLVIYDKQGKPLWGTATNGKGTSLLAMQTDGNLVIYNSTGATWATGTNGRQ